MGIQHIEEVKMNYVPILINIFFIGISQFFVGCIWTHIIILIFYDFMFPSIKHSYGLMLNVMWHDGQ